MSERYVLKKDLAHLKPRARKQTFVKKKCDHQWGSWEERSRSSIRRCLKCPEIETRLNTKGRPAPGHLADLTRRFEESVARARRKK